MSNENLQGVEVLEPSHDDEILNEFNPLAQPSIAQDEPKDEPQEVPPEEKKEEPQELKKEDEPKPEEKNKEKEIDEKAEQIARKFMRLSKMDKDLREQAQAIEKRKAELSEVEEFKNRVLNDPIKTLVELGVDPDSFYAKKLELEASKPTQAIKGEIESLKQEIQRLSEERKQEIAEREKYQRESFIRAESQKWESEYAECMNNEDFKIVKAWDPDGEIVREFALEEYKKTGKLLPARDAVATIRDGIAEKAKALAAIGIFGPQVTGKDGTNSADAQVIPKPKAPSVSSKTISSTKAVDSPSRTFRSMYDEDEEMERIAAKYAG